MGIDVRSFRLFLSGLVGGTALGFLALMMMARWASGDLGGLGLVALGVAALGWIAAPPIGIQQGLPAFSAGWASSVIALILLALTR
jgi:hypothetical protein